MPDRSDVAARTGATSMRGRRTKRKLSARLRTYWALAVFVLVALGGAAWWFSGAPFFKLKSVGIVGLMRVSRSEVAERAALAPGINVWLIDRAAVEHRIDAIPYVASAWVQRRLPNHLRIAVTERTPTACVRDSDHRAFTLDDTLRVLQRGCALSGGVLYLMRTPLSVEPGTFLRTPELLGLQSDALALAAAGKHYRSYADDADGELVATLAGGITVRFGGNSDIVREQGLISPILAALGPRAVDVSSVDLRAPTTPVVEYRPPPHRTKPHFPQQ